MKVTIIGYKDPTDKSVWSGTTSHMYMALKKKLGNVDTITLQSQYSNFIRRNYLRILKYIFRKKVLNFETTKFGEWYWGRRLDKQIKRQNRESDYYFFPAGASGIAGSRCGKKFIYLPDATYKQMADYYCAHISPRIKKSGNEIDSLALKKAYRIVASSKWNYLSILDDYKINSDKVKLIHFGANMPLQLENPKRITGNKIKLLLVGVDYKRKGVDTAIKTVELLNQNEKFNFQLTIVGLNNPSTQNIPNVIFRGRLSKNKKDELKELQAEYKKSDIFILPTHAEAAGISFAEAQMYGLPVITYDTGGVSDYVLNDETGYTLKSDAGPLDFYKCIMKLVENDDKYYNMSTNAIKYFNSSLNWDKWADKILLMLK